jgi:putative membrane-bound dehydrogenase-like protein
MSRPFRAVLLALSLTIPTISNAQPPELDPAKDLPRHPPVEPKDAFSTFQIKPGFSLELAATEPLVVDPIAISFDENGRMYVVEMRDYSERRDERLGRIKLLEDTNGDGAYDKSYVFAEGLAWPTAVFCWDGGVFVGSTPDIIYFKDTNGDRKADVSRKIYSGFGNTRDRLNVQGLMNGFNWGLDNRIHGLAAPNGGIVTNLARTGDQPLDLNNRNFSFDPRTLQMFPESGGGQYGLSINTRGRKFTCSNSDHLMSWMYEARYADRNPYYAMPKGLSSIAADGGAAQVFRLSPEEPWRVIRTQWRVSGLATGPIEHGGKSSGYFTGASGATIYTGNAFPPEFLDNAFVCDSGSHLTHRKLVIPQGVGYSARRPDDEQKVEFLASRDTWFRAVLFANGPDGCFYIMDMYRETIEHPWSLPEPLKKHLDLNSGNDRGRIYRVVPDGFKRPKLPQIGKMSDRELVKLLEHPNGWHRQTAARLIYERQKASMVPSIRKIAQSSKSHYGRMHALYALDGLGALTEEDLLPALRDGHEFVREHAIKLSEKMLVNRKPSPALWAELRRLSSDPSLFVVYQLAFTLGELQHEERNAVLRQCLHRDMESPWTRAAVMSSLAEGAGDMLKIAIRDAAISGNANGQEFTSQLVTSIGAKNSAAEISDALNVIEAADPELSFRLVAALGEGLKRANVSLTDADKTGKLRAIFAKASGIAANNSARPELRVQAVKLLGTAGDEQAASLLGLVDPAQPQEIQLAAIAAISGTANAQLADELINRWSNFTPRVRSEAIAVLVGRPERATALLKAIEGGVIPATDIDTTQVKFLKTHRTAAIRTKALSVFIAPAPKRQDVVDAMMPAISLSGNVDKGRTIYTERCASCHRLEGQGFQLGPDLITVKSGGKEKLLLGILDPNREVAAQFQAYEVETKDDESVIGLVVNETATSVTIRQAYGKEDVILRSNIKKMRSQGQSLMPEGLEAGLQAQDLADLLEYVVVAPEGK